MSNDFPSKILQIDEMIEIQGYDVIAEHNVNRTVIKTKEYNGTNQLVSHWLSEYSLIQSDETYNHINKQHWELQQTINVTDQDLHRLEYGFAISALENENKDNYFFNGIIAGQKYLLNNGARLFYWSSDIDKIEKFNNIFSETLARKQKTLEEILNESKTK